MDQLNDTNQFAIKIIMGLIKDIYANSSDEKTDFLNNIKLYCRSNLSKKNLLKFYLRLKEKDRLKRIIKIVYNSLDEEKKKFFVGRYKYGKNYTRLYHELYLTSSSLYRWNLDIVNKILDLYFYRLSREDFLNEYLLVNIILIMDDEYNFLSTVYEEFSSPEYMRTLYLKKSACEIIYRKVLNLVENTPSSMKEKILYIRITHPEYDLMTLAKEAKASKSHISDVIKEYTDEMQDIFNNV